MHAANVDRLGGVVRASVFTVCEVDGHIVGRCGEHMLRRRPVPRALRVGERRAIDGGSARREIGQRRKFSMSTSGSSPNKNTSRRFAFTRASLRPPSTHRATTPSSSRAATARCGTSVGPGVRQRGGADLGRRRHRRGSCRTALSRWLYGITDAGRIAPRACEGLVRCSGHRRSRPGARGEESASTESVSGGVQAGETSSGFGVEPHPLPSTAASALLLHGVAEVRNLR